MQKYYRVFTVDDGKLVLAGVEEISFFQNEYHFKDYYDTEEDAIQDIKRVIASKKHYDSGGYIVFPIYFKY